MIGLRSVYSRIRAWVHGPVRAWGLVALTGYAAVLGWQAVILDRRVSIWATSSRRPRPIGPCRAGLPCSYVLKGREGIKLPDIRIGVFFILRASLQHGW